jgi:transcriptional regulator with XRE-family HTH domain
VSESDDLVIDISDLASTSQDDHDATLFTANRRSLSDARGHSGIVELPDRLRLLLAARGWRQKELVERSGLGTATIVQLLNGSNRPRPFTANVITESLGVGPKALYDDVECLRAVAQIVKVDPSAFSASPHPEVKELLDELPPDRRGAALDLVRATLRVLRPEREEPPLLAADSDKGKP